MSTTDTATFLLGLPGPVQAQLARIAREAQQMTVEEQGFAAALFAAVAEHFGTGNGDEKYLPGAHMVSALGVLTRQTYDAAVWAALTEGD